MHSNLSLKSGWWPRWCTLSSSLSSATNNWRSDYKRLLEKLIESPSQARCHKRLRALRAIQEMSWRRCPRGSSTTWTLAHILEVRRLLKCRMSGPVRNLLLMASRTMASLKHLGCRLLLPTAHLYDRIKTHSWVLLGPVPDRRPHSIHIPTQAHHPISSSILETHQTSRKIYGRITSPISSSRRIHTSCFPFLAPSNRTIVW